MQTCETCAYCHVRWRKGDKYTWHSGYDVRENESYRAASYFECRRHAPCGPVTLVENVASCAPFPSTSDGDWCGEYKPKEQSA